ncbi:MAG: hypothetical protein Q4E62_02100 [Sutterellaceae bacterium]|nr:hypothetical protein [Sutterellaceae bacterium]
MIKKLTGLAFAVVAATVLTGCAYTNPERALFLETHEFRPELSRASNILESFMYYNVKDNPIDQEVQGDLKIAEDGSVTLEGLGMAASLYDAARIGGPLPGTSSGWGAFGVGMGLSIAKSLFSRGNPLAHSTLLGYLPVEEAPDYTEARAVFTEKVAKGVIATFNELYPNAKTNVLTSNDRVSLYFDNYVEIDDEKLGCEFWNEEVEKKKTYCAVRIRMFKRHISDSYLIKANPAISKEGNQVWAFTGDAGQILFYGGEKQNINWTTFAMALAKHLPEYAYAFIPVLENSDGKSPMFVIEKDRVNFFIKPKAATEEAAQETKK